MGMGKSIYEPFSIAMLVYQRVSRYTSGWSCFSVYHFISPPQEIHPAAGVVLFSQWLTSIWDKGTWICCLGPLLKKHKLVDSPGSGFSIGEKINTWVNPSWLVVGLPLWKILVNWDDEIPNIWENRIDGNQTTNQLGKSKLSEDVFSHISLVHHPLILSKGAWRWPVDISLRRPWSHRLTVTLKWIWVVWMGCLEPQSIPNVPKPLFLELNTTFVFFCFLITWSRYVPNTQKVRDDVSDVSSFIFRFRTVLSLAGGCCGCWWLILGRQGNP